MHAKKKATKEAHTGPKTGSNFSPHLWQISAQCAPQQQLNELSNNYSFVQNQASHNEEDACDFFKE